MEKKLAHVILVDDDEIIGMVTKRLLEHMQVAHHIEVFSDSLKALVYLKEKYAATSYPQCNEAADLILLDIEMPGLGAYQILDILKELKKIGQVSLENTFFAIVTSDKTDRAMQLSSRYNVLALLEKPLKQQHIRDLIYKVQEQQMKLQQLDVHHKPKDKSRKA